MEIRPATKPAEPELPKTETIEDIIAKCFPEDKSCNIELDRLIFL